MGLFLSRALIMVFGYAYPAYQCFKVVEKNRPDVEQLLFWCQYWILVASVTVCERVGDHLISWLPMYGEAKLAFFVYLWYPEAKGTVNFYNRLLRPIVARHEDEIDQNLLELRIKFGKIASIYWQTAAAYGQARFLDILQYVSSQSASLHRSDQAETKAKTGEPRFLSSIGRAAEEKQSKESNASLSQQQHEPASELERIPFAPVSSMENGNHPHSCQQETISKESTYLTRGRWRIFQSSSRH